MPHLTVEVAEVPAEEFMRHNGVVIYHAYKDDEVQRGPLTYWFVTDDFQGQDDAFDVRELIGGDTISQHYGLADIDTIKTVLTASIEMGILTANGVKEVTA